MPLEDNMFKGVKTYSFALSSCSQTIFFTETKGAGMTYPDYHFMLRTSSRSFRPI